MSQTELLRDENVFLASYLQTTSKFSVKLMNRVYWDDEVSLYHSK